MGSLMSGNAACNTTEPSSKKAPPWTTDWRCTTTRTSSNATPKRWCASITSRPLFIMVAESMVIFGPIRHVGCLSASSGPASTSFAFSKEKKGPPDAVNSISLISSPRLPSRHWKIAECSESTGIMRLRAARSTTHSPPATSDSLLARATRLPSCRAPTVAARPAKPTIPLSTTSDGVRESCSAEPGPAKTSEARSSRGPASLDSSATYSGRNSAAWRASARASLPAERPTISKLPGYLRTTSRACLPILPVEPRIVRRRLMLGPISYEQGDIVYRWGCEEQAVHPVEDASVAWEEVAEVLHVEDTLQGRFEEVSALARDRDTGAHYEGLGDRKVEELEANGGDDQDRQEEAANAALHGFVRAQGREQQVTAEKAPGEVRARVGDPGPHYRYEDKDDAVSGARKQSQVRQRDADPERHEEHGENSAQGPRLWFGGEPEQGPGQAQEGARQYTRLVVRDGE